MWQIGHSPGLSEMICGCIAQRYSAFSVAGDGELGTGDFEHAVKARKMEKRSNDVEKYATRLWTTPGCFRSPVPWSLCHVCGNGLLLMAFLPGHDFFLVQGLLGAVRR